MTEIKIQDFESYGNWINNQDESAGNVESINVISPYFDKKIGEFFEPISLKPVSEAAIKYNFPKID